MITTAKDLRFNVSMIFDVLSKGEDVIITYRGKPKAKMVSYDKNSQVEKDDDMFGMWKDRDESVDDYIRELRKSRTFEI